MRWLGVVFPRLALDRFLRGCPDADRGLPLLVYDQQGNRQWVHDQTRAAERYGIEPGMPLAAALSLSDRLETRVRDPELETATLQGLAGWAGQFTSTVCVVPSQGLLLEIEGSLTLFGGLHRLQTRVRRELQALGYRVQTAVAPTPAGALLLARAGCERTPRDLPGLARIVRTLPLEVLDRTPYIIQCLKGMGLRTIGDCLRLPRDGLARRLGPELVQYLDRVLGRVADPCVPYQPPSRFQARLPLPAEVTDTQSLQFAAQRLLQELAGFLLARGAGVQELVFELLHRQAPASGFSLGLVEPGRDAAHLLRLLRERLAQHELAAPVEAVELRVERLVALKEDNLDLFASAQVQQREPCSQLMERLQARLGEKTVTGLYPRADHRPEWALKRDTPGQPPVRPTASPRPLWLLERPEPLKITQGYPWLRGRLVLKKGPERIETGWWDGDDAARDYFVAENPCHERFWVFRERRPPQRWFLHGVFG